MKSNNEKLTEIYVAPEMKVLEVQTKSSLLQASLEGWGAYGLPGEDGEYEED